MTGPVDVVWEPFHPDQRNTGFWDQAIVERLLAGHWSPPGWPGFVDHDGLDTVPDGSGAVVVVPARHHVDDVPALNDLLGRLPWVLLILTGDEEGAFPIERVEHPNIRVWVQTARPGRTYPPHTRWLPNGPTPAAYDQPWRERIRDVVFAGQVTHSRRQDCAAAVQAVLDSGHTGHLTRSAGFTLGLPQGEYLELMASAKISPAPSGPMHIDSFRAWEALELGVVPVLDSQTPDGRLWGDYWAGVGAPPVPVIAEWDGLPDVLDTVSWPRDGADAAAWWMAVQRQMARDLLADLVALTGQDRYLSDPDDLITVLVPTSPIPSHPSTAVIEETIASIRAQLPRAEILIMCDGPNPGVEHRRAAYDAYLYELVRLCREQWTNVLPVIHREHLHQSGMTARAIHGHVATPLVLFAEHDTPLGGPINWTGLMDVFGRGDARVVRFHHEARILPEHEYLMCGPARDVAGVNLAPTRQWSQRPHLATTDLYRRTLAEHFQPRAGSMIEDVLHSVLQCEPWDDWRLWIYHEADSEHGIRRSWHTDGRGEDPKWIGS